MEIIDKIWEEMKRKAIDNNLEIGVDANKEIIIDKPNKIFYIKCRAKNLQRNFN